MSNPSALSPPGGFFRTAIAVLVAEAIVLVVAFVLAPGRLAAYGSGMGALDQDDLRTGFRAEFDEYWRTSEADFSTGLDTMVDYWFRYHLAKAVIAALLLLVFAILGVLVWRAFSKLDNTTARGTFAFVGGGALATVCAAASLIIFMANIQGTVAPFASLLPMLTGDDAEGQHADTLDQLGQQLDHRASTGERASPALEAMITDFTRYHSAMAVIATIAAILTIGVGVWCRVKGRTASTVRQFRRAMTSLAMFFALAALGLIVVAVANTSTVAHPIPALQAVFEGGW
ncbi:hypothetical protein [Nocardia noduli]|uniref:hypothetical protein n=1 Tax=Nocardia noduli TaxID=2815722 RepID=UPI001C246291|nr:hypothetical protein [Nocardia noduli]